MGPKSKKEIAKKKDQAIEDRTFGLKNKNKSAKVQNFIQRTSHKMYMNHG